MILELPLRELTNLVARQLGSLFIFHPGSEASVLASTVPRALDDCAYCFSKTANKYYHRDGQAYFNPFHSGQYSIFLYFLSRAVFLHQSERGTLADRIYYLNKALNGLDLFYEVQMPRFFLLDHPVGSVIGRAIIGEGFSFSQNCTVGNNKGKFPNIGRNVQLMSGAKVLGDSHIGDHVTLSANTYVKDTAIPPRTLVFGSSPNLILKPAAPASAP